MSACERVGRLRGVTWRWRSGAPDGLTGEDMGVIAQEVEAVLPDLVRHDGDGHLRVDYGGLTVELLAAVVELDARLSALEGGADASAGACALLVDLDPRDPAAVAETFPAAVRRGEGGGPWIVSHTLVAPLVEAVKELDARLDSVGREQSSR